MSDFTRTLETAAHAEQTAKLLRRAVGRAGSSWCNDAKALEALAERYTDYAAGLRAMVETEEPAPDPEQAALL